MSTEFIRAAIFQKYGISIFVGVGIPIPILDEDILIKTCVKNKDIYANIYDYGIQSRNKPLLGSVSYEQLRSGSIEINGKRVVTAPLSSLKKAREIAGILKQQITDGEFFITRPVQSLPIENRGNTLEIRGKKMKKIKVSLYFPASEVTKPITYHLIRDHELQVNILNADISHNKQGKLVVDIIGTEWNIEAGLKFIEDQGIRYRLFTKA